MDRQDTAIGALRSAARRRLRTARPEQYARRTACRCRRSRLRPSCRQPSRARRCMLIGAALLVLLVGGGLSMLSRIHDSHVLADETQQDAMPTVAVVHPTPEKAGRGTGAAGHVAGLRRVAHLRAHQRISAALVQGHRQPCQEGRLAGRHRHARSRPGVDAGASCARSRWWPRWTWPRSTPTVMQRCARPIRFRRRKPTPRAAATSRPWPI